MNTETLYTISKKELKPQLRFKEFDDSWCTKRLEEICEMQAGNFVSASEILEVEKEGLFPCYGGNGLRGYTKTFNRNGKYSLIGRQGAQCGNVILVDGNFHATEHAIVVTLSDGFDTAWVFYLLYQANLNQYSTGLAQPGLSVKNLEKVKISITSSLPEQQKIAGFLTAVDTKIQQLTQKNELLEQYKKGVMQQLYSQKLRFKRGDGSTYPDWEEKCLSQLLVRYSENNKDEEFGIDDILSLSSKYGIVDRRELLEDTYSKVNHLNYIQTRVNDFVYAKSISANAPFGVFKANLCRDGLLSTLYFTYKVKENATPLFLEYYFSDPCRANNFLKKYVLVGDRYITADSDYILSGKIQVPTLSEQKKITNYLSALDTKIEQVAQALGATQQFKKGLLQKLFV